MVSNCTKETLLTALSYVTHKLFLGPNIFMNTMLPKTQSKWQCFTIIQNKWKKCFITM